MECLMDHIVIRMDDDEAMIDFYTNVLGLSAERLSEYRAGDVPFPSVRLNAETIIDLFPRAMAEDEPRPGGVNMDHFCLTMAKPVWDELRARLAENGIEIEEGPVERWGARGEGCSIYFRDPEGNKLEARYYEAKAQKGGGTLGT